VVIVVFFVLSKPPQIPQENLEKPQGKSKSQTKTDSAETKSQQCDQTNKASRNPQKPIKINDEGNSRKSQF
jgi:hypothetical protein